MCVILMIIAIKFIIVFGTNILQFTQLKAKILIKLFSNVTHFLVTNISQIPLNDRKDKSLVKRNKSKKI